MHLHEERTEFELMDTKFMWNKYSGRNELQMHVILHDLIVLKQHISANKYIP